MIDTLHKTIEENRNKAGHPFKNCELTNEHSKLGNKHETDHAFSCGVDKIQNKDETHLTTLKKTACKGLLKKNHLSWAAVGGTVDDDDNDDYSEEEDHLLTQESTFSMKRIFSQETMQAEVEEQKRESDYIDCLFFGSSAGIVERLRSKFDALVDQCCSGTSPVMIEAILILKENRDLRSIHDVHNALKKLKENEKSAMLNVRASSLRLPSLPHKDRVGEGNRHWRHGSLSLLVILPPPTPFFPMLLPLPLSLQSRCVRCSGRSGGTTAPTIGRDGLNDQTTKIRDGTVPAAASAVCVCVFRPPVKDGYQSLVLTL